tara:strand:- start:394 stop:939 length:546 start_codon:yes stop_codon:yes gene_type:complete
MVILGLDPGFSNLGWGLLDASGPHLVCIGAGVIRTKPVKAANKCDSNADRCGELYHALAELHKEHKFVFIAAEAQSWTRFANADRAVAMAWGVIASVAEQHGCPVIQIRPQDVKKKITGSSSASKESLQSWLAVNVLESAAHLSSLAKTHQNHASDALAVAVASLDHSLVRMVMRMEEGLA